MAAYERPNLISPKEALHLGYPHRYTKLHEPSLEDFSNRTWQYEIRNGIYLFRMALATLDWSSFLVLMWGLGWTFILIRYSWYTEEPLTFLALGTIFPIIFGVDFSANRRENMLLDIAALKSDFMGLYLIYRDWESAFKAPTRQYVKEAKEIFACLIEDCEVFMEHEGSKERLLRYYQNVNAIAKLHGHLLKQEDWVKSLLSRNYQYQRLLMNDFERIRTIRDFRTSGSIRSYGKMFLYVIMPAALAPEFAFYGVTYGHWAGIFTSVCSSFLLVCLARVQQNIEDPFGWLGWAGINMGVLRETLLQMF